MNERCTTTLTSLSELYDDIQMLLSTSSRPRLWSGANLTRGTVVCCHAPHCGSERRFQHSPLPVRYATVQSPCRSVSSPSFLPTSLLHRVSLRGVSRRSWSCEASRRAGHRSWNRDRPYLLLHCNARVFWSTRVKSLPMGTSANTCARLNGCNSVNSRQLSARLLLGSRSEEIKV